MSLEQKEGIPIITRCAIFGDRTRLGGGAEAREDVDCKYKIHNNHESYKGLKITLSPWPLRHRNPLRLVSRWRLFSWMSPRASCLMRWRWWWWSDVRRGDQQCCVDVYLQLKAWSKKKCLIDGFRNEPILRILSNESLRKVMDLFNHSQLVSNYK